MANWDTVHEVRLEYMRKFHENQPPGFKMMQSMEDYVEMLKKAIKRGTPVTDDDYPDCDIVD